MAEYQPILERMNLKGKTAIVTGAGRGIGRGVARAFAEAGADLGLASRTAAEIEEAAEEAQVAWRQGCGDSRGHGRA